MIPRKFLPGLVCVLALLPATAAAQPPENPEPKTEDLELYFSTTAPQVAPEEREQPAQDVLFQVVPAQVQPHQDYFLLRNIFGGGTTPNLQWSTALRNPGEQADTATRWLWHSRMVCPAGQPYVQVECRSCHAASPAHVHYLRNRLINAQPQTFDGVVARLIMQQPEDTVEKKFLEQLEKQGFNQEQRDQIIQAWKAAQPDLANLERRIRVDVNDRTGRVLNYYQVEPRKTEVREIRFLIGISCNPPEAADVERLKLKEKSGLLITEVFSKSPAEEGGLKADDLLLTVNDQPLKAIEEINQAVQAAGQAAQKVKLKYLRGGEEATVEIQPRQDVLPENAATFLDVAVHPGAILHRNTLALNTANTFAFTNLAVNPDQVEVRVLPLKHRSAEQLVSVLTKLYGEQSGDEAPVMTVDTESNSLVLRGKRRELDLLSQAVEKLDVEKVTRPAEPESK